MHNLFLILVGWVLIITAGAKLLFEELFRMHMGGHPGVLPRGQDWHWCLAVTAVLVGVASLLLGIGGS